MWPLLAFIVYTVVSVVLSKLYPTTPQFTVAVVYLLAGVFLLITAHDKSLGITTKIGLSVGVIVMGSVIAGHVLDFMSIGKGLSDKQLIGVMIVLAGAIAVCAWRDSYKQRSPPE